MSNEIQHNQEDGHNPYNVPSTLRIRDNVFLRLGLYVPNKPVLPRFCIAQTILTNLLLSRARKGYPLGNEKTARDILSLQTNVFLQ